MSAGQTAPVYDLAIIGGGVNGCGVARDAAGRGLRVVLCEQGDLANATSSASTKLIHGGLRYLEHYEFRLVREALREREVLLRAMPHIAWPLRFVLPHHRGLRPTWLLRLGLLIYDHLGGRQILPATRMVDLRSDPAGQPLKDGYRKGFEYSDCWVEDSRLVVLNARDAAERGATILTRTRCEGASRSAGCWVMRMHDLATGELSAIHARALVNAAGPWVEDVLCHRVGQPSTARIRLVRGSHIVVRKWFDHDRAYIFQQADGRIIFALPFERDFTLIGTTEADHRGAPAPVACAPDEADYLRRAASEYFATPIGAEDIVWTYAGVRPLYDDGTLSATAATRDYTLQVADEDGGTPLLSIFGGKITTYRRLAEAAIRKLAPFLPRMGPPWTAGAALPGGDFPVDGAAALGARLQSRYDFLDEAWAGRLVRAYGSDATVVLGEARAAADLGERFGWNLTAREVAWLIDREWARTAEDVLWRRSKLGLRLSSREAARLDDWMRARSTRPRAESRAPTLPIEA